MKPKLFFILPVFLLLACNFSVFIIPTATETPTDTAIFPTTVLTSINTVASPTATDTPTNTAIPPTAAFTPSHTVEPSTTTYTPTRTPTDTPPPRPSIAPGTPGMILRGRVTFNGEGLAGVELYQNLAVYPAKLVAVTDENGYYETEFVGIPGDEMVSLQPKLEGYTFDPPYYYWRHYHGYVEYTWDFLAFPVP